MAIRSWRAFGNRRRARAAATILGPAVAAAVAIGSTPAAAHPHVYFQATVEVVFDAEGRFAAVHNLLVMDYDNSAVTRDWLDRDGSGSLDAAELAAAPINSALAFMVEKNYFTRVTVAGREVETGPPTEYTASYRGGQLSLDYTIPLAEPMVVTLGAGVDIFDPEFYYAHEFTYPPFRVVAQPANCAVSRRVQANIDPVAAMLLRRLGLSADPAIMNDPAAGYDVRLQIDCT